MALAIPTRYLPPIQKLVALPDNSVDELIQAIASTDITAKSKEMAARVADHIHGIKREDLDEIVDLIYSLYHVREYSELSKNRFVSELVEGVREHAKEPIAESKVPHLVERFQRLLQIGTLESITKAITLQRDGERLFCDAKILSDIRPVFGEDVAARPKAAVITHTLKLSYHEEGDHKTFFIVLDEVDLDDLSSVIERAKTKGETLSGLIEKELSVPKLGV